MEENGKNIENKEEDVGTQRKKVLKEFINTIVSALVIALLIRAFVVQAFRIPTGSMESTMLIGDHLLVNKIIYGIKIPFTYTRLVSWGKIHRQEIIVFTFPEDPSKDFIKRCIGLPGDVIEIKDKVVYVNGNKTEEPYVLHKDNNILPASVDKRDNFGPFKVPEKSYFMMGDNRDNSNDSRYWGIVAEKYIIGKALLTYYPLERIGFIK